MPLETFLYKKLNRITTVQVCDARDDAQGTKAGLQISHKNSLILAITKLANMTTPAFPNGFSSWQKTHFEVVEVLCYIRGLDETKQPKSFAEMIDRTATEEMYELALSLTNKYEEQNVGSKRERSLFDEIEEFVWTEVKGE